MSPFMNGFPQAPHSPTPVDMFQGTSGCGARVLLYTRFAPGIAPRCPPRRRAWYEDFFFFFVTSRRPRLVGIRGIVQYGPGLGG